MKLSEAIDEIVDETVFKASSDGHPDSWSQGASQHLVLVLDAAPRTVLHEMARRLAEPMVRDGIAKAASLERARISEVESLAEEARQRRMEKNPVFRVSEQKKEITRDRANQLSWDSKHGAGTWQRIKDQREERAQQIKKYQARLLDEDAKREEWLSKGYFEDIQAILEKYKDEVIQEWTDGLLAERFQLEDGRFVSWGDATETEHRSRHDVLLLQSSRSAKTATRHLVAAELILAKGTNTLAEAVDR